MMTEVKYEYLVFAKDDNLEEVNKHVQALADMGWELVSGCASPWVASESPSEGLNPMNVWHTKYVTYWRREKTEPTATTTE